MADVQQLRVRDLMQTRVVKVPPKTDLSDAKTLMALKASRHLLIVDAGKLVGVVSDRDVLAAEISSTVHLSPKEQVELGRRIPLGALMTKSVQTTDPDALAVDAAARMQAGKFSCMPVVEGGEIVGIVTVFDLLGFFIDLLQAMDRGG